VARDGRGGATVKRIGFIMLSQPQARGSPIMPAVVKLLGEWGAKVEVLHPERQLLDLSRLRVDQDLYVLKASTDMALTVAGCLHAQGAAILNSYPVSMMLRDKIVSARILQRAGVPTPKAYLASHPRQLGRLLEEGPLVIKPYRSGGEGAHVVWDADDLDGLPIDQEPLFAQRFHRPDGPDRRLYSIKGQVFGVLRPSQPRAYEQALGEPFTVAPDLREIALRCGEAFGIDLYGLDVVMSEGTPFVVDVSSFPGFKGVPDAALRLADYINWVVDRVLAGEPLTAPRRKVTT